MKSVLSIGNQLLKIFKELAPEDIEQIEQLGFSILAKPGETVVKQGTECKGLLLLVNGSAKITLEEKQNTFILQFLKEGETFFIHEAFMKTENRTNCISKATSLFFFIPNTVLHNLVKKHPHLMVNLINLAAQESDILAHKATSLVALPIKFRFIDSLILLTKKLGIQNADHLFVPVKRDEIGSYINASKASLSRIVNELENSNIIKTSRDGIQVFNQAALLKYKS